MFKVDYVARMVVKSPEITGKEYPHFTLGCTERDEAGKFKDLFSALADFYKKASEDKNQVIIPSFKPLKVINLNEGTEDRPYWAVELDVSDEERDLFAKLFDSVMCPEKNGILYLWKPEKETDLVKKKAAKVSIGFTMEDKALAEQLLKANAFQFEEVDYKKLGRNAPHLSERFISSTLEYNKK